MDQELTPEQQAEIIVNQIIQATKNRIVSILEPAFDKISSGHHHFDKKLADAILTDIKNA
jgi:hypothetical protein